MTDIQENADLTTIEKNLDRISNFMNQLILTNSKLKDELKSSQEKQTELQNIVDQLQVSLERKKTTTEIIEKKVSSLVSYLDKENNTLL